MKLTAQQIIDIFKNAEIELQDFAHFEWSPEDLKLGEVQQIHVSGGMDKGSDWRRVFHFKNHDVYLQVHGWYSSYDGLNFDDGDYDDHVKEVFPKEKTIIVYE